jgi:hypothetical protein
MLNTLIANDILNQGNPSEKGCTIPFFETKKASCSTKTEEKTINRESERKKQLNSILDNIKKYKEKSENEKKKLQEALKNLKKEFQQYKAKKKKELAKISRELKITKKKLSKNKKKLLQSQKKLKLAQKKLIRKKVAPKKVVHKKSVSKKSVHKKVAPKKIVHKKSISKKHVIKRIKPLAYVKNLPWVEIVVDNNLNIYQLALKYYGDRERYKEIYSANQHLIGRNLKIHNGMSLKIPMTKQFKEQPMILNTQ